MRVAFPAANGENRTILLEKQDLGRASCSGALNERRLGPYSIDGDNTVWRCPTMPTLGGLVSALRFKTSPQQVWVSQKVSVSQKELA